MISSLILLSPPTIEGIAMKSDNEMLRELMANLEGGEQVHWRWALKNMLEKENPWPPETFYLPNALRCNYKDAKECLDALNRNDCCVSPAAKVLLNNVVFEPRQEVAVLRLSLAGMGFDKQHEAPLIRVYDRLRWMGFQALPSWVGPACRIANACVGERILVLTEPIVNPQGESCDKTMLFAVETNEEKCLYAYGAGDHTILSHFDYLVRIPQNRVTKMRGQ